ncbi:hypothetical protein [Gillisia sp. Hel_I_86]|uniref:hypothetical protein n=1 Tax=Gillisia sp. Hel_I_86 TaxID=1249981 RepID=UPI001646F2CE|nr:hypothetical protein [Gillisia sp. Hel_I_86]
MSKVYVAGEYKEIYNYAHLTTFLCDPYAGKWHYLRNIQDLLGHSRPEKTRIYTHVSQHDLLKIKSPLNVVLKQLGIQ